MNSAFFLSLKNETVKSGTAIQEELKSAILLRCVGGQLKPHLKLTIGDNVQHSTLREQQSDRSQQKWATSMVASSSTLIEFKMPKEKVRKARMTIRKAKVKMLRAKERKEKEIREERKVITGSKVNAKTRKARVWQRVTLVEGQDILLKTVGGTIFER